jgi:hypothetical protein
MGTSTASKGGKGQSEDPHEAEAPTSLVRTTTSVRLAPADQHDPLRQLIQFEELGARHDVLLGRHAETDRHRSGGDPKSGRF